MSTTTHYSWQKPDVGGSNGTWGTTLNTDLDDIDSTVFDVSEAAAAAQSAADNAQDTADEALAGGAAITPVAVTLTGGDPYAGTFDLDLGSVFLVTQTSSFGTSDINLTFTNRPATHGKIVYLHFIITGGGIGSHAIAVRSTSGQSQWVVPFQNSISGSGAQTLASFTAVNSGTATYLLPIYIVAGV